MNGSLKNKFLQAVETGIFY